MSKDVKAELEAAEAAFVAAKEKYERGSKQYEAAKAKMRDLRAQYRMSIEYGEQY